MVTCHQIYELDIMRQAALVAGRSGLGREVTWPYAKHTRELSPWVRGGEFVLVSDFEEGVDETALLDLLEEAVANDLAGFLVEGGKNFRQIPDNVKKRANQCGIPLFFVSGVCSFRDISEAIIELLMEPKLHEAIYANLLDRLLEVTYSAREKEDMLRQAGIPDHAIYCLVSYSLQNGRELQEEGREIVQRFHKKVRKNISTLLREKGVIDIHKSNAGSVEFLLYVRSEEEIEPLIEDLKKETQRISAMEDSGAYFAVSSWSTNIGSIKRMMMEVSFVNELSQKGLIGPQQCEFAGLGSYRILFNADKDTLIAFRDELLCPLVEADDAQDAELLRTLEVFLQNNGNMLRTSEALFVHRNTLQYRLNKIRKLTGLDLNNSQARRDFQNALLIAALYPMQRN